MVWLADANDPLQTPIRIKAMKIKNDFMPLAERPQKIDGTITASRSLDRLYGSKDQSFNGSPDGRINNLAFKKE